MPTKYKGLFTELGPYGKKSRSSQGQLEFTKKNGVAMHLFEIIEIEMLMSALNFFWETMVL